MSWTKVDGPVELVSEQPYSSVQRALRALINQSLAELDEIPVDIGVRRIYLAEPEISTDVISVDANGRPAEYRVAIIQLAIFTIGDKEEQQSFRQFRDYVFDVRDILAYQQQVKQLKQAMSEQLARQILYTYAARVQLSNS
ncbi:MAG: hypothetical protein KJO69_04970 [Gammaproteobacteria bacterium]|nr:hypothetical protein [Gammaproteobacteria bacterium]